jgi:hypothetical protein
MDITIPWNASWTGEAEYEIRNCRWVSGKQAIWQRHAPGVGQPIFAKPHMVRQRRSIAEMRCTVCGERTAEDDRWWFRLGRIDEQSRTYMTTEAPVHLACAKHAQKVCPHLRSLGVDPEPMPTGWSVMAALVGGHKATEDFQLPLGEHKAVIGSLKIAYPIGMVMRDRARFGVEVL